MLTRGTQLVGAQLGLDPEEGRKAEWGLGSWPGRQGSWRELITDFGTQVL